MFFSDDLTFKGNIDDLIAQGTIFEIILEIIPFIKESFC